MNKILLLLFILFTAPMILSAQDYWQQEVRYSIKVSLDEKEHTLHGFLSLNYTNHSPDTLGNIWFHLWPNAYNNKNTALARQRKQFDDKELINGKKGKAYTGYIDSLQFLADGQAVILITEENNPDIVNLQLPHKLWPGQQMVITTPFRVKLPRYYSRSGYMDDQHMICQWYPKPAVYDSKGWHPIPYLDQGEFYSEYGSYQVEMDVPAAYVVGATGVLQTAAEIAEYKRIGAQNLAQNTSLTYTPSAGATRKTLQYHAENVHDFAWFADRDAIIQYDTLQLASGKIIDIFSYRQPDGNKQWQQSTAYIKDAVMHYSNWLGEYPWPVAQAVEGPYNSFSGGMEYPMITLITAPKASAKELDGIITHEVGHNWFYGILGSNERDHAFMDEGINTFYEYRYEAEKYHGNSMFGKVIPKSWKNASPEGILFSIYMGINAFRQKEPIDTPAQDFPNKRDYAIVVYGKAAGWVYLLETVLSRNVFDNAMKAYFAAWKFKHPYPENLQAVLQQASGKDLEEYFKRLHTTAP